MENTDTDYACKPITTIHPEASPQIDRFPIIMVDRGNCTFVTKTRNIQNIGGHLALIVNNRDNDSVDNILMIDDGTGSDITIPAILINHEDGEKIKTFLRSNLQSLVLLSVEFQLV